MGPSPCGPRARSHSSGGGLGVSREKLRNSIQAWEQLAWPFERARTPYELGIVYQRKGDREEAGATLDEALATFTELGAKTDIEKVLARKDLLKA